MDNQLVECPVCEELLPENELLEHTQRRCQPVASSSRSQNPFRLSGNTTTSHQSSSGNNKRKAPSSSGMVSSGGGGGGPSTPNAGNVNPASTVSNKKHKLSSALEAAKPLAERVRPKTLDEIVGQSHLLAKGALLRSLIERDSVGSLILWGPPGTGKTTLARVIASTTNAKFTEISATHTNSQELRKAFEDATNLLKLTGRKTLLFVDECQRLAKNVQELFLPHIEAGTITCLLATTENPSFRLQTALLSRCRVFVLKKLSVDECEQVLKRALQLYKDDEDSLSGLQWSGSSMDFTPSTSAPDLATAAAGPSAEVDDELLRFLAGAADGDARVALSTLELALKSGGLLSKEQLRQSLLKAHLQYDRTGDQHYDTISALHKSIRGSDADAALYWLARMLEGGEDPLYIARRMVRMAAEDVGTADPAALPLAIATYQSAQLIGMPESDCILAECAVYLAEAKKSVRVYKAYNAVKALVREEQAYPVPLHIRNAPTTLMKKLDYGKEYLYEPGFAHPVLQSFMPPELADRRFLRSDDSFEGKEVDLDRLREWEAKNGEWPDRARLEDYSAASPSLLARKQGLKEVAGSSDDITDHHTVA